MVYQLVAVVLDVSFLAEELTDLRRHVSLRPAKLLDLFCLVSDLQPKGVLHFLRIAHTIYRLVEKVQLRLQNLVTDVRQRFILLKFKYNIELVVCGAFRHAQLLRELLTIMLRGRDEVDKVLGATNGLLEVLGQAPVIVQKFLDVEFCRPQLLVVLNVLTPELLDLGPVRVALVDGFLEGLLQPVDLISDKLELVS